MELQITLPTRNLYARLGDTIHQYSADEIAFVLKMFDAPVPDQTEEWFGWKLIQLFKGLTRFTDEDLQEWQRAAIVQFYQENPDAGEDDGLAAWLSDLKQVINRIADIFLDFDASTKAFSIKPSLFKNPLPWLLVKNVSGTVLKLYAPYSTEDEPFGAISLAEYGQIVSLYDQYRNENDEFAFYRLCAILYRPKTKEKDSADIRMPLEKSESKIMERAAMFKRQLPDGYKRVIDLHIVSCSVQFAEQYPDIFSQKKSSNKKSDLVDFVLELANFDPIKQKQVLQENVHDMFEIAARLLTRKVEQV